MVELNN